MSVSLSVSVCLSLSLSLSLCVCVCVCVFVRVCARVRACYRLSIGDEVHTTNKVLIADHYTEARQQSRVTEDSSQKYPTRGGGKWGRGHILLEICRLNRSKHRALVCLRTYLA